MLSTFSAVAWAAGGASSAGARSLASKTTTRTTGSPQRYFGAAARIDQISSEPGLAELFLRQCTCITPEIHLKWDALEWEEGRFSFEPADDLVRFAVKHGMSVRGHTLLWDQSTPRWAKKRLKRERDWSLIKRHFDIVLGRYADHVSEWDVINEPVGDDGSDGGFRRNTFFEAFGPSYVERALRTARERAPRARLAINDYGFDYDNPVEEKRRTNFLKMIETLRRADVPIDSVGVQAHLDLSKGPLNQRIVENFLNDLAGLGLDIAITELDVKERDLRAPIPVRDARVAAEVQSYLEVALAQPAVRGVITWGLSDRHSWLQDQMPGGRPKKLEKLNRGLPFDAELRPKPLHGAILAALQPDAPAGALALRAR